MIRITCHVHARTQWVKKPWPKPWSPVALMLLELLKRELPASNWLTEVSDSFSFFVVVVFLFLMILSLSSSLSSVYLLTKYPYKSGYVSCAACTVPVSGKTLTLPSITNSRVSKQVYIKVDPKCLGVKACLDISLNVPVSLISFFFFFCLAKKGEPL